VSGADTGRLALGLSLDTHAGLDAANTAQIKRTRSIIDLLT
jgi:hypothetical protein